MIYDLKRLKSEEINKLLYQAALKARESSYSPYSHFRVGAAALTEDGELLTGANIENRSYGATICAERVALTKAFSEGKRNIIKLAIASDCNEITYPCGICLQVIFELMPMGEIILCDKGEIKAFKVKDMLPYGFDNSF